VLNLSMKPTGWFHIGSSAEIPPGGGKLLLYFDQHLCCLSKRRGHIEAVAAVMEKRKPIYKDR
jgi:3-ketosteroid 9alpha-monooxygenase subunit A